MASFPIINKVTGEKKVINKSVHDIQQWYEDNPEWQRDWSEGCASSGGEAGEWQDRLVKSKPGGNDVLDKASKAPGSKVKKI